MFQLANVNKLGITLNLDDPRGRELLYALLPHCDVLIDNFSPRVMDNFGITWADVHARSPRTVMIRMPAFGLSGPARDRSGFAYTIEQATGMAWPTGYPDGPPMVIGGVADPIAGVHAALATLAAVERRDRTGTASFVEAAMVDANLNVAAELLVNYSAYGETPGRAGNRGPDAAPQGVYPCAGLDSWIAIAVQDDTQWTNLGTALGDPAWAVAEQLTTAAGRRAVHDAIDAALSAWTARHAAETVAAVLHQHAVPCAIVVDPLDDLGNQQFAARGFLQDVTSPVVGSKRLATSPIRLVAETAPRIRTPAPALGEHNDLVLGGLLGLDHSELEALARAQVIGNRPRGA
jgi:crotonobetainyl-CoA:carnitine CoA-transferase CaiB-like acyl-CoA transferase